MRFSASHFLDYLVRRISERCTIVLCFIRNQFFYVIKDHVSQLNDWKKSENTHKFESGKPGCHLFAWWPSQSLMVKLGGYSMITSGTKLCGYMHE